MTPETITPTDAVLVQPMNRPRPVLRVDVKQVDISILQRHGEKTDEWSDNAPMTQTGSNQVRTGGAMIAEYMGATLGFARNTRFQAYYSDRVRTKEGAYAVTQEVRAEIPMADVLSNEPIEANYALKTMALTPGSHPTTHEATQEWLDRPEDETHAIGKEAPSDAVHNFERHLLVRREYNRRWGDPRANFTHYSGHETTLGAIAKQKFGEDLLDIQNGEMITIDASEPDGVIYHYRGRRKTENLLHKPALAFDPSKPQPLILV